MRSEQVTIGRTQAERIRRWRVPLSCGDLTLRPRRARSLPSFGLRQAEVPLETVQLNREPQVRTCPGFDLYSPMAPRSRDARPIHVLLGRGLLAKDEAFVIGFTMGSTDRVGRPRRRCTASSASISTRLPTASTTPTTACSRTRCGWASCPIASR
jgi:hypothetical protein